MKWSKLLVPTIKEVPNDAEVPSHQLMLRAGLIRKLASGTYIYLPMGFRTIRKITEIVRQEMDAAGGQEVLMPSVQPMELWAQTGRNVDYGETLGHFTDRHGRENVLSPTAEEVATFIACHEIKSYKQLPINLYQISFKFRDEFRPRFGVLRSREFTMKDAYSFHASEECLHETYMDMYNAYCKIFQLAGVEYVIVEAETGEMGGSGSHQFTVPCETGEDVIVYTEDSKYACNIEKAPVDAVAKAEPIADAPAIEEIRTPSVGSIETVCEFLKAKPQELIKTLIYKTVDDEVIAVLVRGDNEMNPEKVTQLLNGKGCELANEETIEKVTSAKVGFAGPIGLAEKVAKVFIDHSVAAMAIAITGANKSGYHVKNVVPGRDFALEGDNVVVADIRNAVEGDTFEGKKLLFKRGIEVGQVFKLGAKYSKKMGANFLDENGKQYPCLMGCYGIGINRIMASAIENGHDENGIIWPISIAPFEVIITPVNHNDEEVMQVANDLYNELKEVGVDVIFDDRPARGGVKFKDADLIGIPIRVTVGGRGLKEGKLEVKMRREAESENVDLDEVGLRVCQMVEQLYKEITGE
ncbi:MAG: proline--tRNA ligase [Phycisphaerae bacterium]|nr:proline--tRNA ligase [Phycisphaerae bacterium]